MTAYAIAAAIPLVFVAFFAYAVIRGGTMKPTPRVTCEREPEMDDELYRFGGSE